MFSCPPRARMGVNRRGRLVPGSGYVTSRRRPVSTSYTEPRTWSHFGFNGLAAIRALDFTHVLVEVRERLESEGGRMPVSASICRLTSSSENVSIPRSEW